MRYFAKYKYLIVATALGLTLLTSLAIPSIVSAGPAQEVPVCQPGDPCGSFLEKYINPFVVLFSVLVGVLAAISIVVAGIQYAMSADDPGKVTQAKTRILNTVIGLIAYIFLFAFLNYIVPGGIV